jgi:hypothetical protein
MTLGRAWMRHCPVSTHRASPTVAPENGSRCASRCASLDVAAMAWNVRCRAPRPADTSASTVMPPSSPTITAGPRRRRRMDRVTAGVTIPVRIDGPGAIHPGSLACSEKPIEGLIRCQGPDRDRHTVAAVPVVPR